MKYFKLFESFVNEDLELAFYTQGLNEGKMGDFFGQIRELATKAAEKHYEGAAEHIDVAKLEKYPLKGSEINSAQKELEKQSFNIDEGFLDSLKNLTMKSFKTGLYGSIITGSVALTAGLNYIDATFNKWYYQYIQGMAESDVMKVMTDLYGAKAAEGGIWFKIGLYAFFVFFTLAVLSYITARIIHATTKNIKEAKSFYTLQDMIDDNKSERDIQKAVAMCAVALGLNPDGVAIVTTEDDDYDQYSKKYKSAKFKKFDNPSADMETAHSETDNIIMFNDGSVSGYMIPVERMDESSTVAIVEASNVYSKAASELFMNVAEILKHYMLDDEYDYNEFKPGIKKIRNQEDLTKWYENMIKDLKDVYEDDESDNEAIKAIVKESPAIAKKAGVTLNSIKESKELNEAKISYSLEDLMGDVTDKDYIKMCELIARTIGEKPKDIAVITSEDDEFGKYQARFRNNPTAAINNPSSETSTYYDKKSNVVTGNDGSTIMYFIPSKQL